MLYARLEGIALSDHGVGAAYRDVQALVKALSAQGVLLAINSKNDVEDALLPFRKHLHAVLFGKKKFDYCPAYP